MKLSIIIVSYNVKYYLEQCLRSVQSILTEMEAEIIVIDNQSSDDSVGYLFERFHDISFINLNQNLGFSKANNIAIKQSKGEYILLLNPDTIVPVETLRNTCQFMDQHPKAGGVGVRMIKTDGSNALESRRGFPTPLVAFFKICGLCAKYPQDHRFGKYYMGYLPWNEATEIDVISGAYFCLRRSALEQIGLLDEAFFMYGEDIDLSYRLKMAGWQNWYLPTPVLHYKGESTQKSSFRYVHTFYRAMLIFFRKHYSGMSILLSVPIKLAIFLKAMAALVNMEFYKIRKNLGFSMDQKLDPLYLMIGSELFVDDYKRFAKKKGIRAQYLLVDEQSLFQGDLGKLYEKEQRVYAVYDIEVFSYDQILSFFSKTNHNQVHLGTYEHNQHILITKEAVLK